MSKFDLHVHTTASDGAYTPTEVVQMAYAMGLGGIAITDHDTLAGVKEAREAAKGLPFAVISGVEISLPRDTGELHMLGLYVDEGDKRLNARLDEMRSSRVMRIEKTIDLLAEHGFYLDKGDFLPANATSSVGRYHLAKKMVQLGYVSSTDEAFDKWLAFGKPCYVKRTKITIEEAIELIHGAGGLAVLAHPGGSKLYASEITETINAGVDGIEAIHPSHSTIDIRNLLSIAHAHGLFATGGSDFHDHVLGICTTENEVLLEMMKIFPKRC